MCSVDINGKQVELLSIAELRKIAQRSWNEVSEIVRKEVKSLTGISGFLGEYFTLTLTLKSEVPGSEEKTFNYFLKSLPIADQLKRGVVEHYGMFVKERTIYRDLLQHMGGEKGLIGSWNVERTCQTVIVGEKKWRPMCFYIRHDMLVFEDLTEEGYEHFPARQVMNSSHIRIILRSMAHFHAASIAFEKHSLKEPIGVKHSNVLFEVICTIDDTFFMAGLSGIVAVALNKSKFSKNLHEKSLLEARLLEKITEIVEHLNHSPAHFFNVLCHRDIWRSNVLFRFSKLSDGATDLSSPQHAIFVDYQNCRYNPPAVDVVSALHWTTNRTYRESNYEADLRFYYDTLRTELCTFGGLELNSLMSWTQFMEQCNYFRLFGVVMAALYRELTELRPGILAKIHEEDQKRYNRICEHNRDDFILEQIEADEYYAGVVIEAVEEVVEVSGILENI